VRIRLGTGTQIERILSRRRDPARQLRDEESRASFVRLGTKRSAGSAVRSVCGMTESVIIPEDRTPRRDSSARCFPRKISPRVSHLARDSAQHLRVDPDWLSFIGVKYCHLHRDTAGGNSPARPFSSSHLAAGNRKFSRRPTRAGLIKEMPLAPRKRLPFRPFRAAPRARGSKTLRVSRSRSRHLPYR